MKVENLEKKMDRQEQYSRGHCNLIHWLKEEKKESTDVEFWYHLERNWMKTYY